MKRAQGCSALNGTLRITHRIIRRFQRRLEPMPGCCQGAGSKLSGVDTCLRRYLRCWINRHLSSRAKTRDLGSIIVSGSRIAVASGTAGASIARIKTQLFRFAGQDRDPESKIGASYRVPDMTFGHSGMTCCAAALSAIHRAGTKSRSGRSNVRNYLSATHGAAAQAAQRAV